MPLVGFVCVGSPSKGNVPFAECVECAASGANRELDCHYSPEVLRAMIPTNEEMRDEALRITSLTGCVRQTVLDKRVAYYETPDRRYSRFLGSATHSLLQEFGGADDVVEQRFYRELDGVVLTGKPDVVVPSRQLLRDFKRAGKMPLGPSPLYVAQLNAYRWLVAPQHTVERLELVYLGPSGVRRFVVGLWDEERVEDYLRSRSRAVVVAQRGGALPPMVDLEYRWMCKSCPSRPECDEYEISGGAE